jgi:hypothetical protein
VSAFWRRKGWLRGVVGITAAYAFALQMVLVSIVGTQMAAAAPADPFAICYGDTHEGASGKTGAPVHHATCAVCSLLSFSPLVSDAPKANTPAPVIALVSRVVVQRAPGARLEHSPRSSQGPPQAA